MLHQPKDQIRMLRIELQILALELEKIEDGPDAANGYRAIPPDTMERLKNIPVLLQQKDQDPQTPPFRHLEILNRAIAFYGKNWRDIVSHAWHTGDYRGADWQLASDLQSLRNHPNRTWSIAKVKAGQPPQQKKPTKGKPNAQQRKGHRQDQETAGPSQQQ